MVVLLVLYALALAVVTVYGANHGWLALRRASAEHLESGPIRDPGETPSPPEDWPFVTVQLAFYNEALVAERVVRAVGAMQYPRDRFEVQVLDDSTDETTAIVARVATELGRQGLQIMHLHRRQRTGFKAGALAEGLRVARGDLIAIFDADFLPERHFLARAVPLFDQDDVGCVQTRWRHINGDDSLLTRMQAMSLDAHFELEQRGRDESGCFLNFNGTAGIWRRAAIEDAGGWSADTLTEDLDLSYRAQMRGWRLRYTSQPSVPAELPVDMAGFRSQQRRWTVGALQTAFKLVGKLLRAPVSRWVRLQGTLHLTAHLVYPAILLLALLNAPVALARGTSADPGGWYWVLLSVGVLGLAGYGAGQIAAQRALRPDWPRRLLRFPVLLAGSMGLALSHTLSLVASARGRSGPFVRTPKFGTSRESGAWWHAGYANRHIPTIAFAEIALAAVLALAVIPLGQTGAWSAVPFQILFAAGLALVGGTSLRHAFRVRRTLSV